MIKTLLLATAVAGAFTLATSAHADDAFLSPKAKEVQDSLRTVPGTTPETIDRSPQPGTPKTREVAYSMRKVPGMEPMINLTRAPRPLMAPKDPRYDMAALENAVIREFEVALLK